MDIPLTWWVGTVTVIVALLLVDLLVVHRDAHVVETREAGIWSAIWIGAGLLFGGLVWASMGSEAGQQYLTGYLIEKSLSVDNLFVFVLIFTYFSVPAAYQHRVLFYGILGALVLRGIFIAVGATLLNRFSWVAYVFGVFLVFTAWRLSRHEGVEVHPEKNPLLRWVRRAVPMTDDYQGQKLFVRRSGALFATPLFAVLVVVETTDVIFAVDSIPAIFAVTREPFLVFTSNAFALLGLRALYFLLADLVRRFRYLTHALSFILAIVGLKLIYEQTVELHDEGAIGWFPEGLIVHIPSWAPLLLVAAVITTAIVLSLVRPEDGPEDDPGDHDTPHRARRRDGVRPLRHGGGDGTSSGDR